MDLVVRFALGGGGGALGAMLRYAVSTVALAAGVHSSLATLTVNILGCFAMGALASTVPDRLSTPFVLLGTGVLGGFTTFSAFALDASALSGSTRLASLS
jgi:CrcB protein